MIYCRVLRLLEEVANRVKRKGRCVPSVGKAESCVLSCLPCRASALGAPSTEVFEGSSRLCSTAVYGEISLRSIDNTEAIDVGCSVKFMVAADAMLAVKLNTPSAKNKVLHATRGLWITSLSSSWRSQYWAFCKDLFWTFLNIPFQIVNIIHSLSQCGFVKAAEWTLPEDWIETPLKVTSCEISTRAPW